MWEAVLLGRGRGEGRGVAEGEEGTVPRQRDRIPGIFALNSGEDGRRAAVRERPARGEDRQGRRDEGVRASSAEPRPWRASGEEESGGDRKGETSSPRR